MDATAIALAVFAIGVSFLQLCSLPKWVRVMAGMGALVCFVIAVIIYFRPDRPPSPDLNFPRASHSAVQLQDGKVMVIGGVLEGQRLSPTELFDPSTSKFAANAPLNIARGHHQAVLLADGRILVVGDNGRPERAEIYDPHKRRFSLTETATTSQRNSYFSATLLKGGRVLLIGSGQSGWSRKTEIYDPEHDGFTPSFDLQYERLVHTATLLNDGRILIAGGDKRSEVFNIETGSIRTGDLSFTRTFHTATLLSSGNVLIVGGKTSHDSSLLDSAEIFDFRTGAFEIATRMVLSRYGHTATLIPNGSVIIIGGFTQRPGQTEMQTTDLVEQYNPREGVFRVIRRLRQPRAYHTATLLRDGKLLIVGGVKGTNDFTKENVLKTAEIIDLD